METTTGELTNADAGRVHTRVSLAVLGVVGGLCLALAWLAHDPRFESWTRRVRWDEATRSKNIFMPVSHLNDADRALNEEFASTDHTRGGVYILGTSNLLWALKFWALPPAYRERIHNYGVNATGHVAQFHLIRFMVEQGGLLKPGPEKSLVVFAASYQNAGFVQNRTSQFSRVLALHGFFTRGPGGEIYRSRLGPLARSLILERARIYGLADELAHIALNAIKEAIGKPRRRLLDPQEYNRGRTAFMGPDWKAKIDVEVKALARGIDYLQARKVPVAVVLMPQGSWEKNVPFDRTYTDEVLAVCRSRGVKVVDLRRLLDDDDFADSNHFTPQGVEKFQDAVLPLCLDHLRATGNLPEGPLPSSRD